MPLAMDLPTFLIDSLKAKIAWPPANVKSLFGAICTESQGRSEMSVCFWMASAD